MDPLALYIHWPFCLAKCPYCDFNSHVRDRIPQDRFARALRTELAWEAARLGRRPLASIFFGGGTPSPMEPDTVAALIADATSLFDPPARAGGHAGGQSHQRRAGEAARLPGCRGQPGVAGDTKPGRHGVGHAGAAALRRAGRRGAGPGAGDVPARVVRPDLCPARPGRRGVAGRAGPGAGAVRGPPVALSAHHRTRHRVRGAAPPGRAGAAGRRPCGGPLHGDRRRLRGAWPAALRGVQPCPTGRGEPAQPGLLALCRLCRRRAGRAWPRDAGGGPGRHPPPPRAGTLGRPGGAARATAARPRNASLPRTAPGRCC